MIRPTDIENFIRTEINACADEVIENKVDEVAKLMRQEMIRRKSAIITELMSQIQMGFETTGEITIRFKP